MSYSKSAICNIALQELDHKGTVTNIDLGQDPLDIIFRAHFDRVRRQSLREMSPNFARSRKNIPVLEKAPEFGYPYAYQIPTECLKFLGIGEIYQKTDDYVLENVDGLYCVLTEQNENGSLPLRYVIDVENYNIYTDDFIFYFAKQLALAVRSISQNITRIEQLKAEVKDLQLSVKGVSGQENPPMRRSISRIQPRQQAYNKVNKR